ncbi:hypothetical protein [Streptomyces xanthochromogenes]
MTQTNKHRETSDRSHVRVSRRLRAWIRTHRHNVQRDILHGAATKLGSTAIGAIVFWIEARR